MSQDKTVDAQDQNASPSVEDASSSTPKVELAPIKVLFLDIDGVLNSTQSTILHYRKGNQNHTTLDEVACSNLQYVLECVPECKIVLSSTWRKLFDLDWMRAHLRKYGIDSDRLFDKTPVRFSSRKRGYEIQEWLDDYKEEGEPLGPISHFVIVDDDPDMVHLLPKLVQTNGNVGLTWGKAEELIKALGSSSENWKPEKAFPYHMLEVGRTVVSNEDLPEET